MSTAGALPWQRCHTSDYNHPSNNIIMSTSETFAVPGAEVQQSLCWEQSFEFENKPLKLAIYSLPIPLVPVPYEFTVAYGEERFRFEIFEGESSMQYFQLSHPPSTGLRIMLCNWRLVERKPTVRLTVMGYVELTSVVIADERIAL